MSNRSLIEINHDYSQESPAFVDALARYVRCADRETAKDLERFGIRVIGMRHHSGNFILDGHPDGFPVTHLEPRA